MFARLTAAIRGLFTRQQTHEVNASQATEQSVSPPRGAPSRHAESPLDLNKCTIEWDKADQQEVGGYSVVTVKVDIYRASYCTFISS